MIAGTENPPIPIDFRNRNNIYEKIKMCNKAVELVKENTVIFIDGSTTTLYLADCIPTDKNITVVTNSILVCAKLCEKNIVTHCTGGVLVPSSKSFVEQRADYSDMETSLRRVMLENSKTKFFMCDFSKFSKTSSYNVTDLDSVDYIITDKPLENAHKSRAKIWDCR